MRKRTILYLLCAILLVVVALTAMSCVSGNYQTNTYEIMEEFEDISIQVDKADVTLILSDDEVCKVILYEKNQSHTIKIEDDRLIVNVDKKWYDFIGVGRGDDSKITVALPKSEYSSLAVEGSTGDVEISKDFDFNNITVSVSTGNVKCCASSTEKTKIDTTAGDICVENVSSGSLDLMVTTGKGTVSSAICTEDVKVGVSTGNAYLNNVSCKNVVSGGSTGDIFLNNVVVTEKISIERSTGDVQFESSDASEIFVETDNGYVTGTLLTNKDFIIQTKSGNVDIPETMNGGKCEIITNTGDIKISILED